MCIRDRNWNVTVQRQLPLHTVLTVAYVGHRGNHAWQVYDINQPTAVSYTHLGSGLTGKYFNRPNQTNVVSLTSTISPSLVNEARLTLSIDDVYIPVNSALAGFNRQTLGITFPYLMPNGKDFPNKIPTVSVPNFYGLAGGPYPSHSSGTIWTGSDTLTKVWNNHTIKAGFSFEYSGENDGDQINVSTVPGGASNQNGTFYFTDGRTGLGATAGVGMACLLYTSRCV